MKAKTEDRRPCPKHADPQFGCRECLFASMPTVTNDIMAAAAEAASKGAALQRKYQADIGKRRSAAAARKKEAEEKRANKLREGVARAEAVRAESCGHEQLVFGCPDCFASVYPDR